MPPLRNAEPETVGAGVWESFTGEGDPQQRFRIYRLCSCEACGGSGKIDTTVDYTGNVRCDDCRGEGRVKQLVATAETPAGVGEALVQNGREGAFLECPVGVLDTEGEKGQKWLISPWLPSARNISDAGRTLAGARHAKGERDG
jgi:hypothetical protein